MNRLPEGVLERTTVRLRPDPARIVSQLFVAGEEMPSGSSRATTVMRRVLALSEEQVETELAGVFERFGDRHEHLSEELVAHFEHLSDRTGDTPELSVARRMLVGAYATSEYAFESVSLCNPSIVAHPDQSGIAPGQLRFLISLRAIGEGHLSSIELRAGTLDGAGGISVEEPGRFAVTGTVQPGPYDRDAFAALLAGHGGDVEVASMVLGRLPGRFTRLGLEESIAAVPARAVARGGGRLMIEAIRTVADSNYTLTFPEASAVSERVVRPAGPAESHGMEDARFVRFVDDDGTVTYYGTYTAFDGARVAPQLIATDDFRVFRVAQLAGPAADQCRRHVRGRTRLERRHRGATPGAGVGAGPSRQLRLPDRDRRGVAGDHPRGRPDAGVLPLRAAARPGRPPGAAGQPGGPAARGRGRRAGRLCTQRRLQLRGDPPRRLPRAALRLR
jgi:hypothetical protein